MVANTTFIIGGEQIYAQAMSLADRLEITEVDLEPEGDAWFPAIAAVDWEKEVKPGVPDSRSRLIAAGQFEARKR